MRTGVDPRRETTPPTARNPLLRRMHPRRRTLRLRLTLWYVAVLALTIGVIAVLFYWICTSSSRSPSLRGPS